MNDTKKMRLIRSLVGRFDVRVFRVLALGFAEIAQSAPPDVDRSVDSAQMRRRLADLMPEALGEGGLAFEADGPGDLRHRQVGFEHQASRPFDAALHDIAVQARAHGAAEGAAEMEGAEAGDGGQRVERQVVAEMSVDILGDTPQPLARQAGRAGTSTAEAGEKWRSILMTMAWPRLSRTAGRARRGGITRHSWRSAVSSGNGGSSGWRPAGRRPQEPATWRPCSRCVRTRRDRSRRVVPGELLGASAELDDYVARVGTRPSTIPCRGWRHTTSPSPRMILDAVIAPAVGWRRVEAGRHRRARRSVGPPHDTQATVASATNLLVMHSSASLGVQTKSLRVRILAVQHIRYRHYDPHLIKPVDAVGGVDRPSVAIHRDRAAWSRFRQAWR